MNYKTKQRVKGLLYALLIVVFLVGGGWLLKRAIDEEEQEFDRELCPLPTTTVLLAEVHEDDHGQAIRFRATLMGNRLHRLMTYKAFNADGQLEILQPDYQYYIEERIPVCMLETQGGIQIIPLAGKPEK